MPSKMHLAEAVIFSVSLFSFGLSDVIVQTTAGKVRGSTQMIPTHGTLSVFYGIPYAKPPLGDLRFRKPQPPVPWTHVLDATNKPNSCTQKLWSEVVPFDWIKRFDATTNISEDCLYLNVWTPAKILNAVAEDQRLPVIFWIHGGGFVGGSSMVDIHDGAYITLMERVVFVSVNYRLGPLGFLYLGNEQAPGNMGLYDMVLALDWVKSNIRGFGGNPDQVTIIGESAGGASVSALLLSPVSRDKFQYAVIQSGSILSHWGHHSKGMSLILAKSISVKVNCTQANSPKWDSQESILRNLIDCLRKIDAKSFNDIAAVAPTIDGHFFPASPFEMLANRNFKLDTKIMSGHTSNEGSLFVLISPYFYQFKNTEDDMFVSKNESREIMNYIMGSVQSGLEIDLVYYAYNDWTRPGNTTNHRDNIVNLFGDLEIICSNLQFSKEISVVNTVYYYQFNHRPNINKKLPLWSGAMHQDEIQFFFGSVFDKKYDFNDEDRKLSKVMMKHLGNFARTGSPVSASEATKWRPFTPTEPITYMYGLQTNEILGPRARQCALHSEILPQLKRCKAPVKEYKISSANRFNLLQTISMIIHFLIIFSLV